jgi:hypothetical protein
MTPSNIRKRSKNVSFVLKSEVYAKYP